MPQNDPKTPDNPQQAFAGVDGLVKDDTLVAALQRAGITVTSAPNGNAVAAPPAPAVTPQGVPAWGVNPTVPQTGTPPSPPAKTPPSTTGTPPVTTPPVVPAAPAAPEIVIDTPLGKQIFGTQEAPVNFDNFQQFTEYAKKYNINVTNNQELANLVKEYDSMRGVIKTAAQYKQLADNYERIFSTMPTELATIVNMHMTGKDYMPIVRNLAGRENLNYDKDFDSYSEQAMINRYSDKKYTKEEFDALDPKVHEGLREYARTKYNTDKLTYQRTLDESIAATTKLRREFATSVDNSLTKLKASYPTMGEAQIQKVKDVLSTELQSTLFNSDNTYREDAAERVAMMLFGREVIETQNRTIGEIIRQKVAEGKLAATEDLLLQSNRPQNKPPVSGVENFTPEQIKAIAKEATSFVRARG